MCYLRVILHLSSIPPLPMHPLTNPKHFISPTLLKYCIKTDRDATQLNWVTLASFIFSRIRQLHSSASLQTATHNPLSSKRHTDKPSDCVVNTGRTLSSTRGTYFPGGDQNKAIRDRMSCFHSSGGQRHDFKWMLTLLCAINKPHHINSAGINTLWRSLVYSFDHSNAGSKGREQCQHVLTSFRKSTPASYWG